MKYFELTLTGFDATTDETDDLVKWIAAPNLTAVELFAVVIGLDKADIQSITPLGKDGNGFWWPDRPMILQDGINVIVDEDGQIVVVSPGGEPFTWKSEVCRETP